MKTLLILHGWQSSKERWQKVKEQIEKENIEVIVPDLPGFKTELAEVWNLDDYVDWFYDFSLSKEKFFLLGHSFGGRVAIKFAVKYPQRISGLILVSSAGIKKNKNSLPELTFSAGAKIFNSVFRLPILNKFYSLLRKIFYRYILKKTDYLNARGIMKEIFKKIVEEDLTPYLSQINAPALIIWGEKDKITPLGDANLLEENIKNSKLEILKNVGHTPHLETSEKLAEIIIQFIKTRH